MAMGSCSKSPQRLQDLKPVLTLNLTGGCGNGGAAGGGGQQPSTTKNNNNNHHQLGSLN